VAIRCLLNRILRDHLIRYPIRELLLRTRLIPNSQYHEPDYRLEYRLCGLPPPSRSLPD